MRRILTEVKAFLKTWTRSKSTIFWTIAFPVMLMLIFGAIFSQTESSKFELHVQNLDIQNGEATQLSLVFISLLNQTDALDIVEVDLEVDPDNYITENDVDRLLIIPEGFHTDTLRGSSKLIFKAVPEQTDASTATVSGIISAVISGFNSYLTGAEDVVSVETESIVSTTLEFIDFFMPGVIGMTVMTTGMFGAISVNSRFRELGILRRLAVTPLSKLEWILGVVFYQVFLAFFSAAVILIVGLSVFGVTALPNVYAIVLLVCGALAFPGMGMLVAHFVKEPDAADAAGNAIAFPMMFLSGTFFPLEMMPDFLRSIASVLPLTYFNNGLRDAMIYGNPTSALNNSLIMLGIAAFFIAAGSLVTKWRE